MDFGFYASLKSAMAESAKKHVYMKQSLLTAWGLRRVDCRKASLNDTEIEFALLVIILPNAD